MLLFQTSREIIFYFQHFIQVCFYFLGKETGVARPPPPPPRPLPLLRHCGEVNVTSEIAHETGAFLRKCSVKRLVRRYNISMNGMLEHRNTRPAL